MADRPELNPLIIEAIVVNNDRILIDSIAESQGVVNEAYAHSLALIMHNAGATQFAGSQTANAAIAATCAAIINAARM
jgi:hypothetical protein